MISSLLDAHHPKRVPPSLMRAAVFGQLSLRTQLHNESARSRSVHLRSTPKRTPSTFQHAVR